LNYDPKYRWDVRRPRKRWIETETGHKLIRGVNGCMDGWMDE